MPDVCEIWLTPSPIGNDTPIRTDGEHTTTDSLIDQWHDRCGKFQTPPPLRVTTSAGTVVWVNPAHIEIVRPIEEAGRA